MRAARACPGRRAGPAAPRRLSAPCATETCTSLHAELEGGIVSGVGQEDAHAPDVTGGGKAPTVPLETVPFLPAGFDLSVVREILEDATVLQFDDAVLLVDFDDRPFN
eukprot:1067036-Prymnesium_polylepis.1